MFFLFFFSYALLKSYVVVRVRVRVRDYIFQSTLSLSFFRSFLGSHYFPPAEYARRCCGCVCFSRQLASCFIRARSGFHLQSLAPLFSSPSQSWSLLRRTKSKTYKMPFGSCFKARATALALLCCCTILITLPAHQRSQVLSRH
jgi:hypothetical protein